MNDTRKYVGDACLGAIHWPSGTQEGPSTQPITGKGTLDQIFDRIIRAAAHAKEIAAKLNQHADAVSGPVLTDGRVTGLTSERDAPSAALDRIHMALDELDRSQIYTSDAADRNCTLV